MISSLSSTGMEATSGPLRVIDRHGDDAFAAAPGDPVFVGRGALAIAIGGNRQNDLFRRRHGGIALGGERRARLFADSPLRRPSRERFGRFAGDSAAHLEIGHAFAALGLDMAQDGERDDPIAFAERDAAHAHRIAPLEDAHIGDREADALAVRRRQQHVVVLGADLHVDDLFARVELHRDLAGAVHLGEVGELVAPDGAARRREDHVELLPLLFVFRQRHDGRDALALFERQDVDERLAARLRRGGGSRQTFSL